MTNAAHTLFRKTKRALQLALSGQWGEAAERLRSNLPDRFWLVAEVYRLVRDGWLSLRYGGRLNRGSTIPRASDGNFSIHHAAWGARRKNVIWVMLDALRQDIFAEYLRRGGFAQLEPSAHFTRAFVQGSWTYPSVFSFLTGLYPFNCGVSRIHFQDGIPLSQCGDFDDAAPTIFKLLRPHGYRVGSILDGWGFTVRTTAGQSHREDRYFEDEWGWFHGQGQRFLSLEEQRQASESFVEEHAGRAPFVLFVRSLYTHSPYREIFPNPEYVNQLSRLGLRFRMVEGFIHGLRRFEDQYLQPLLEALRRKGVEEDTIIILCSDHGEMLWDLERDLRRAGTDDDDEKWRHQLEPYNALIHVPLLISGAGMQGRYTSRFRLIDLVPTLLDVMGIDFETEGFDGRSLRREVPRPIYADSAGYGYGGVAFQLDGSKLLASSRLGATAYALEDGEYERLTKRRPATIEIEGFRKFHAEQRRSDVPADAEVQHTEILERRLRDLGYLE